MSEAIPTSAVASSSGSAIATSQTEDLILALTTSVNKISVNSSRFTSAPINDLYESNDTFILIACAS
eukprot:CAMPEP_0197834002 /NCGR_PEP_ID=MMETSP1437-20131217/20868_1 /TAXON_ID=49252 ORGANISM="Eucampia antarctica, Strain CCMP1452" /NCGR_SAMPLE_ID=MMETSP1437 /ASSEMBLY_ACC=CAM_ASM_001096 /LENGTH=66 /DNA_ID=CAMNT_0043438373 /DNA_START=229 /DNA_END=426 /DNA_ORIENTATION=+